MPGDTFPAVPIPGSSRDEDAELFHLLRSSHIFASAVREFLESKPLKEASSLPLTISQFHLLKLMAHNGRHQVREVADFLGVSPPAATKNVDKLERLGLVIRKPSHGDRRVTWLSVSNKGRRLVERYEEIKIERLTPVLKNFRLDDLDLLADLLERFSIALMEKEKTRRGFCLRCDAYIQNDCPIGEVRGGCPYKMSRKARSKGLVAAREDAQ
jgi:DNA-binding MarR family transcriptional regulator